MPSQNHEFDHNPARNQAQELPDRDAIALSRRFSVSIPIANDPLDDEDEDEPRNEPIDPFGSAEMHEHLLRSGPLGRCNDPYCTTCHGYFEYTDVAPPQSSSARNALFGGARNVQVMISGWGKDWMSAVFHPHTEYVQKWNQFFVISCLVAIFIDPLFFLLFSVRQTYFCITFSATFATVVTALRSITDFIYFLHMLLQFKLAYMVPTSRTLVDDPKEIAYHYLRGWFILDMFAVLPLPQIMVWLVVRHFQGKKASANYAKNLLRVTVLLQYIPRCIRFLPLVAGHSQSGFVFETAWVDFGINLFMYLLAGHVVGACWYLFGLQRVNLCLQKTCELEQGCSISFLDCGIGKDINATVANDMQRYNWSLVSNASTNCLVIPSTFFNYGIYINAVPVTMYPNIFSKYLYSLFWGCLQISTLAGNLVPSLFKWEVLFTMAIIGLGLLLFALLIGNMQNFLQSLGRRQMDMQLRRYDVEVWMKRRNLPHSLRRKVRQAERLKWAATRGVDEDELLEGLPEDLHKEIRRELALDYLKKVRIFQVMQDIVLDAICERLHQKFYIENSIILRARYPVDRMLFILRGNLMSIGDDGSEVKLCGGDFCGEELLTWSLEHAAIQPGTGATVKRTGQRALSSRTVKCHSSVEAFALEAADLEFVVNHFSRYMRNSRVQGAIRYESPYFRTWAARCIQAAWRYRKKYFKKSFPKGAHLTGRPIHIHRDNQPKYYN